MPLRDTLMTPFREAVSVGRGLLFKLAGLDAPSWPSITAGSGAPSEAEADGSVYLRLTGMLYQRVSSAWVGIDLRNQVQRAYVEVTPSQLRALRATPQTLVAAPGAGKFLELVAVHAWLDYGSVAHDAPANASDDFTVRYTNGSGNAVATFEATTFINASSDQHRVVNATSGAPTSAAQYTPAENAALVLHNSGAAEFSGTGNSPVKLEVFYRVRTFEPAA